MSLVGSDGDLLDFVPGIIARTNTPGNYQDLVTRNGGGSHGCPVCSYDALGNVLSSTDARGFTTVFDRNELGEIYRVTSPAPYYYKVELYYDANRNVVRENAKRDTPAYLSLGHGA
jgi:YD repeat-containing protein